MWAKLRDIVIQRSWLACRIVATYHAPPALSLQRRDARHAFVRRRNRGVPRTRLVWRRRQVDAAHTRLNW